MEIAQVDTLEKIVVYCSSLTPSPRRTVTGTVTDRLALQAGSRAFNRAEVRRSFNTTTVRKESQVTPQGRHR